MVTSPFFVTHVTKNGPKIVLGLIIIFKTYIIFLSTLTANGVDKDVMSELRNNEVALKELIPQVGTRIKFMKKINGEVSSN